MRQSINPTSSLMLAHATEGGSLHKCRLTLKDIQSFLETVDLGLTAGLALCIALDLVSALLVQGSQVIIHCIKFGLDTFDVSAQLCGLLVQASCLLGFVLHILLLCGFLNG